VKGFEYIRGVHLEAQPFDVERDLTTPTFKLKRPQLLKYYQVKIAFETPLLFFFSFYISMTSYYHSFRHLGIFIALYFSFLSFQAVSRFPILWLCFMLCRKKSMHSMPEQRSNELPLL